MNNHQHKRQHAEIHEKHGGNCVVDDEKLNDGDSTRAGTLEGSPQPGSQQGRGGRKRVFSNRTKTGCITCRRRKKKCDEGKPECFNCKRGGFFCEGYSGKINWQKPPGRSTSTAGAPVNIQSKTEQAGSASASPSPAVVQKQSQTHRLDEVAQHQSPQTRVIQYPYDMTPTVVPEKQVSEESTSPSAVELPTLHPSQRAQTPQASALPAFVSVVPQQVTPTNNTIIGHRASVSVSQAAITAASGSSMPRERSEWEKMVHSEWYFASAPELVQERERCKTACWRFNSAATNPDLGISKTEKGRLLHQILRPGRTWEATRVNGPTGPEVSYIDDVGTPSDIVDVRVDAPFNCSYGYNIRLGKDVLIEAGCTILDSGSVTIKARTILSPDVSIYSATHRIDPRKRNGSKGPELAKPVTIEEDCWLGGNVIVLGGISIGKGSVVGAGSVVTKDVPPYTVVAGNPARVIRGVYSNDSTDM
ncbi:trimeric LpxA-like protein [Choiromyces venosus 120613-1]|uniref:Trimeric LpxA-like protein n=1 Tax=Choiromyces venosus 120613-1 TaxID=1336337 RepID=A0A3N4JS62_9PEZI|nr:trimeric LpxA-like protein [Choiromyces venosus 120613-1]